MKLALLNAKYQRDRTSGGNAHIGQFVRHVVAEGHEVWMDQNFRHPLARSLPSRRLLDNLPGMDAVYIRVCDTFPDACRLAVDQKRRHRFAGPLVWEFNVGPDYGSVKGASEKEIRQHVDLFRQYGSSCDLAICVSRSLSKYVEDKLGLGRVITVPNGSDPDLFHPDVSAVDSIETGPGVLNVAWIGSAHIPWHNLELLRRTAALLGQQEHFPRIAFHVIGGRLDEVGAFPANVTCHGPVTYEHLPRWLAAMDVGLVLYHPGPAEMNSPLKMFDCMASGLAVIGSSHPQITEVLQECGQLESVLSADDPGELAAKLLDLSENREKLAKLGREARQRIVDKYNWKQSIGSILEAID